MVFDFMKEIFFLVLNFICIGLSIFGLRYAFKKQRERDELYFNKLTGSIYEALIEYEAKRFDNEMTLRYYDLQRKDK